MRRIGVLVGTCDLVGGLQHPVPLSLGAGPSPGRVIPPQCNLRVAQRESESVKLILRWRVCVMHRRLKSLVHVAYRTAGAAMVMQNCVRLVTITISNHGWPTDPRTLDASYEHDNRTGQLLRGRRRRGDVPPPGAWLLPARCR